jgi:serine/threonine protein kinase
MPPESPSDAPPPRPPPRAPDPGDDPLVGALVADKYRVIEAVARGGMGRIYRAVQEPLGRVVALKTLLPQYNGGEREKTLEKRFLLEASTCSKLDHPNTVKVFDYGTLRLGGEDTLFMVMEFVSGRTLAQALRADGAFPPARVLRVAKEIARSLREAHANGVVHRDLKPSNVMLVERDDGESVKVLDFGVAKVMQEGGEALTSTGSFVGSPRYTAPEQIRQEDVDGRCDLYALGCVMYELLVGAPPFASGEPMRTLLAHLQDPVPSLRARAQQEIPDGVEALIMRCLEKERDRRWPDVAAFLEALRAAEEALGVDRTSGSGSLPSVGDLSAVRATGAAEDPSGTMDGAPLGGRSAAPPPPRGVATVSPSAPPGLTSGGGTLTQPMEAPAPSRTPLIVAAFVAVVALGALGALVAVLLVLLRQPSEPAPAEPARDTVAEAAPPPPDAGVVTITSVPSGATVYEGDARLGRTPLTAPAGADRVLRFRLAGHQDLQLAVGAGDRTVDARMVPSAAPPSRPSPRPTGAARGAGDDIRTER